MKGQSYAKSLRARMTLGVIVWSAAVSLLAGTGFLIWSRRAAHEDAHERVRAAARLVAYEWDGNPASPNIARAFREAREDMRLDNIAILLVDDSGRVMGANTDPAMPWPGPEHKGWLVAKEHNRTASAVAGMEWRVIEQNLRWEALFLFAIALASTAGAGLSAWVLVGRTLRPIGALSDQANAASSDPLLAQLTAPSEDAEVFRLVGTLNGLLERLRENTRTREQFYAAAAHELRTPLSVLSSSVELSLSRPRENTEYQETLTDLQLQIRRLITLAEGLLTLNRLDMHLGEEEEAETVDVADLCERAIASLSPLITDRHLQINLQADDACNIRTPPTDVAALVRNLIENAVKYAKNRGQAAQVSIEIWQASCGLVLRVRNDFPCDEILDLERLFEPFYQADPSRTAGAGNSGGNGLGLAIARRISRRNNWKLELRQESGGVYAEVIFPLYSPSSDRAFTPGTT
jgi:signal transduction histidine kinase